jgi:predicted nucleotidyltransferase
VPDVELDVEHLLRVLLEHEVKFVMIGGMAAVVHGSPFPTEDVDITPEHSAANLERLSQALDALEARVRTPGVEDGLPFSHDGATLGAVAVWNLVTPHGILDISFVPNGTTGYPDLAHDAADIDVFGLVVPVASLADIIRSKQAANRPKDQRVLPTLREILASRFQTRD